MNLVEDKQKIADFNVKMQMPYSFKVKYARIRALEFRNECEKRGLNYHISVGGLDSITLLLFLRSIGIDCPAVSVSLLEDASIQKIHKQLGVIGLRPSVRNVDENGREHRWTKAEILQEFGFPVISKSVAGRVLILSEQKERTEKYRHYIVDGDTSGDYGKLAKRWLELFGGYENEYLGTNYKIPPFKISDKCCYYLKEKPLNDWAREHHSAPYLGLMASEGGEKVNQFKKEWL